MMSTFTRFGLALGIAAVATLATTPATIAADVTDIGYVDQSALATTPSFVAANRTLQAYKSQLDREFARRIRGVRSAGDQARIAQQFQNQFATRQREVLGPLLQRTQVAIASVASSKDLSVIVDKRIVIVGGQDVTGNVAELLAGPGDPIPPVSTPPPSSVGYVDQSAIDAVPKLKAANDDFQKFQAAQMQQAQAKIRSEKSPADRQQTLKDYQNALADRNKTEIQPLVDRTRDAIADVAKKRGLLLVIDRSNLIFGGTDITKDVTAELQ